MPKRKIRTKPVMSSRSTGKSQSKGGKIKSSIFKVLLYLGLFLSLLYILYFFFSILSIESRDIIKENSTTDYLLSKQKDNPEKVLIIFEESYGNDKRITDVYGYLVNREKKSDLLIYLPGNVYYGGLEEKFGNEIPVSSFRYAGDFLQKGRGVEYSVWQLSQLLGFKNSRYIFFTAESTDFVSKHYGDSSESDRSIDKLMTFNKQFSPFKIFTSAFDLSGINKKIYSNMKFYDIQVILEQISNRDKKFSRSVINMSEEKYLKKGKLGTGEEINVFNSSEYDKVLNKELQKVLDRKLENERARVEVYNGSELSGVAYSIGRKIMNSGCDVVRYGNAPNTIDKTQVYVSNMKDFTNSYLNVVDVLSSGFDLIIGRPEFMTTGDIVVILGRDIKSIYSF